jgi:hypothetical protein
MSSKPGGPARFGGVGPPWVHLSVIAFQSVTTPALAGVSARLPAMQKKTTSVLFDFLTSSPPAGTSQGARVAMTTADSDGRQWSGADRNLNCF